MNFLGIGAGELLLILVIILLVMGPERLPQLMRQWAKIVKTLSQFTRTWQQFSAELNRQLNIEEMESRRPPAAAKPAPKPAAPVADVQPDLAGNSIAPPGLHRPDPAAQATPTEANRPVTAPLDGGNTVAALPQEPAPLSSAADEELADER